MNNQMNNLEDFMKVDPPLNNNENNNLNNNINNEDEKNNKRKIFRAILYTILVLVLTTGAYIFGTIMEAKKPQKEEPNNETSSFINEPISSQMAETSSSQISEIFAEPEPEEPVEVITNKKILKYVDPNNVYTFYKGKKYDKSAKEYTTVELLLFKDTSYFMTYCFMACNAEKGTYEFTDNKLVLNQEIFYGSDACYFREKETFKYKMDGDNIIVNPQHGTDNVTLKRTSLNNINDIIDRYEGNEYELEDCTDM